MFNSYDTKSLNEIRDIFTQVKYDAEGNFLDLDKLEAALDKIPISDYSTKDISNLFKLCIDYEDRYQKKNKNSLLKDCYDQVARQIDIYQKESKFLDINQSKMGTQTDIARYIIDLEAKVQRLEAGVYE